MTKVKPIPEDGRDTHNNPLWNTSLPVELSRMDNSLAMTVAAGTFTDKNGKVIGDISMVLDGFVFIIHDKKSNVRVSINCKKAIEDVFCNIKRYTDAPKMPHPKSKRGH